MKLGVPVAREKPIIIPYVEKFRRGLGSGTRRITQKMNFQTYKHVPKPQSSFVRNLYLHKPGLGFHALTSFIYVYI